MIFFCVFLSMNTIEQVNPKYILVLHQFRICLTRYIVANQTSNPNEINSDLKIL